MPACRVKVFWEGSPAKAKREPPVKTEHEHISKMTAPEQQRWPKIGSPRYKKKKPGLQMAIVGTKKGVTIKIEGKQRWGNQRKRGKIGQKKRGTRYREGLKGGEKRSNGRSLR